MYNQADFSYLRAAAEKYGNLILADDFETLAREADANQLAELAAVYEDIEKREDIAVLSRWIDDELSRAREIEGYNSDFPFAVLQLLTLFGYLSKRNLKPFNSNRVQYLEDLPKLDWSKLPSELAYLIDPAESLASKYQEDDRMLQFSDLATDSENELLIQTCEKIRTRGDYPKIKELLDTHPFPENQESWLIYCLLLLMDYASLSFE